MKTNSGFTLVEMMITIAVTMLLLVAVYAAINSVQRSASGIERKVAAQQDVKPALDLMALEISMASYNPTYTGNIWVNPPGSASTCGATSANQTYKGIQEATASAISIEMDIRATADGSTSNGALGDPNETIRYNYVSGTANQYITRSTNCTASDLNIPFLGDVAANTRAVRVINDTLGLPVFRYFSGTGACILEAADTPAGICVGNTETARLPAAIPNIRRIEISLAVETEEIDPATGVRRRLIYSTSVIPRNHAINQ